MAPSTGAGDDARDGRHRVVDVFRLAAGPPVEDEMGCAWVAVSERLLPAGLAHEGGGDEDTRAPMPWRPRERHALDGCEAFVVGRRLELAKCAHLLGRREQASFRSRRLFQLVRERKRPEAIEQALDEVDLRLRERRVEPDTAGRDAVARRRLHDVAAHRAGEVGVVEDDLARP